MPSGDPKAAGQLLEGRELLEPQHLEGVAVQGLTFECASDDRPGEALAHPNRLGVEEVAAGPCALAENSQDPVKLGLVRRPVGVRAHMAGVADPAQNDQCADLESLGQTLKL